ncbi:MAG: TIR domain-containing protein [Verrucomicrobia bacterium]|nr:TIR domain-containing protein [Verrucomicrobiota bacterium]
MSAEVFISYAARDRERVLGLVERLRKAGVTVWIDQVGIDVSTMWSQEIVSAIKGCKVMLLSISPHSTGSENVVKELALASERKKPIIPVYLEAAEIPETMEYQLAGIQRVEYFRENEDAAFKAMLRSLVKRGVHVDEEGAGLDMNEGFETSIASHSPEPQKTTVSSNRKVGVVTPLLVLAVIGLVLALVLRPGKPPETSGDQAAPGEKSEPVQAKQNKTSITVLPFRNIGPSNNESFLADGMHEEIDAMLSMTPSLTVKNASRMKDMALDPRSVGEALKVDSVLTGTVRQSDGQLRVTVKLVNTKTEENIWASTFDKSESDIFSVQREIAQRVVEGLKLKLGDGQQDLLVNRQTKDLEAYNLYINGRKMWKTRTREGMRDSIEKFEIALSKDPDFALAYVGIADAYNQLVMYGHSPPQVAFPKAKEELKKALALNDSLSEAHASFGFIQYVYDCNWDAALKSLIKALNLNPNYPDARRWLSHVHITMGNYSLALEEIDNGINLEPNSGNMLTAKSFYLIHAEKTDDAIKLAQLGIIRDPNFIRNYQALAQANLKAGDYDAALKAIEKGDGLYLGEYQLLKARILASRGDVSEAKLILDEEIKKKDIDLISSTEIAKVFYDINEDIKALDYLEMAIEEKDPEITYLHVNFDWNRIGDSQRFKAICKRLNLPAKP